MHSASKNGWIQKMNRSDVHGNHLQFLQRKNISFLQNLKAKTWSDGKKLHWSDGLRLVRFNISSRFQSLGGGGLVGRYNHLRFLNLSFSVKFLYNSSIVRSLRAAEYMMKSRFNVVYVLIFILFLLKNVKYRLKFCICFKRC